MTHEALELREYQPRSFPRATLSDELGDRLWRQYGEQVDVEFPSPRTEGLWRFTSKGWVGSIPLDQGPRIDLRPKVELANLFRMLEYAYNLASFRFLDGERPCDSLPDLYERLARVLARRVLSRCTKGLYGCYVRQDENLPFVRGGLRVEQMLRSPAQLAFPCHYDEHTADLEENRILAWTLRVILRSGLCTERTAPTVRAAYRVIQSRVPVQAVMPRDCMHRLYNRLNEDYEPMHLLCRFFLEHTGPSESGGSHEVLPFLVNMGRLYEEFVAAWLRLNISHDLELRVQEQFNPDPAGRLQVRVDLAVYDRATGKTRMVLDTKYKTPEQPSPEDRNQVVAYAQLLNCRDAVLVYPQALPAPLDSPWGEARVRSATFSLSEDLDAAGRAFLSEILGPQAT